MQIAARYDTLESR
jgi:cold shock protein